MLGFILILALLKPLCSMKVIVRFSFWLIILGLWACKTDSTKPSSNTIVVRIPSDLRGLNPVNHNSGSSLRIIKQILPSLVDFDPVTETYTPVLIEELPQRKENSEKVIYSFRFRKEAKWPNGSPITIDDYIFSLKVAFNRKIRGNAWTGALSIIEDVEVDKEDNLTCRIVLAKDVANIIGYFAGFELLPEYHYDPNHLLASFPLKDFLTVASFDTLWKAHPEITEFAHSFSQEKYIRDPEGVVGAGPYRLESWTTNEQIVLVKRKNYWADGLQNVTAILAGYPDTIIYKIVTDEIATSLLIKNKQLDVIHSISSTEFLKLKENPDVARNYDFYTPSSPRIFLVLMNTQSPKLDKSVRNALARCIDLDQILDVATSGFGRKIISPLSSKSPYYNHSLKPIEKNIEQAKELLDADGWKDMNRDGVRTKNVNGQQIRLELNIVVGASSVGKVVGPILKSSAEKIGIKINIQHVNGREIISQIRSPKFEMSLIGISTSPTDYEPYGSWHSDNAGKKGKNYSRLSSSKMDKVIDDLRMTTSTDEKKKLYAAFQKILYDEQPVLFLYSPSKTIIVQNRWEPMISSVRPGFFENAFRLKRN